MAAGQQVALEQPLADVLGQHLDRRGRHGRGARRARSIASCQSRPVTSRMSWSRLLASSSGAKVRKLSGLRRVTSRSQRPEDAGGLVLRLARASSTSTASSRQSGRCRSAQHGPAVGDRVGAHPAIALRREVAELGAWVGRRRRTAPRGGTTAATPRARGGARRRRARRAAAPGGARNVPSTCWPSTTGGHVQPFGVRSTIIGQRRSAVLAAPSRARCRISAMPSRQRSSAAAMAWWTGRRVVARPRRAARSRSRGAVERSSSSGIRASSVGLAILYSLRCRTGSTAPSCAGSRNLRAVPARGQRTGFGFAVADDAERHAGRGGRARRRTRAAASSRARHPRGTSPGVSGAQWLGTPPGNEKWRKAPPCRRRRRVMWPSSSDVRALEPGARVRARGRRARDRRRRRRRGRARGSPGWRAPTRGSGPGTVPKCPSSRGLTCSGRSGSRSSGLPIR